jgi:DNA polymerase III epsilon subunit-like protein
MLDFETTGWENGNKNAIIQTGAISWLVDDSKSKKTMNRICRPAPEDYRTIEQDAVKANFQKKVCQVSFEQLEALKGDEQQSELAALTELLELLRNEDGYAVILAHNATFERDRLQQRVKALLNVLLYDWCETNRTSIVFIDTIQLFYHLDTSK